ncbi:MAG: ribosome biogenesis GTPase YlqF [Clostridiales bacterium]|nr:ribosome biogenesis GTPase YlqF [Clostridiales bacterium]
MKIQWYPGHMTKTRRMMEESLPLIDLVCEIVDARIPISSRNPDVDKLFSGKPRLIVMNRSDQSDPEANAKWTAYFQAKGYAVILTDSKRGSGIDRFLPAVRQVMSQKLERLKEKGMAGRGVKIMVVGVPNVGKSSFINRVIRKKSAIAQDRPGVTRGKQWFSIGDGFDLLDTPGILWPKFDDETTGMHLAFTGAVRDEIIDIEELSCNLIKKLSEIKPEALNSRYKIKTTDQLSGFELLQIAAKNRGFLISGGEVDLERMAHILLDEYRGGLLGRITLELPPDLPIAKSVEEQQDG